MGFFTRILGEIWSLIQSVLLNTATAALADDANLGFTAILLIVVTVALMSGCWASSIAETRLHSPKFHFFIGLLLPLVYPLVILFAMPADLPGTALASEEPKPWEDEPAPQKAAAGASPGLSRTEARSFSRTCAAKASRSARFTNSSSTASASTWHGIPTSTRTRPFAVDGPSSPANTCR